MTPLSALQQGYATIANTGLNAATEMTIAAWVYLNSSVEWQRVWDFGNNTTTYMFLSPKSSVPKFLRFAVTTGSLSGEQGLDGTSELAVGAWKHVAVPTPTVPSTSSASTAAS